MRSKALQQPIIKYWNLNHQRDRIPIAKQTPAEYDKVKQTREQRKHKT